MKLSHLSLAILAGISLAACGGSGSSNHVTPDNKDDNKGKEVIDEVKPGEDVNVEDKEIVDPTNDEVVSYFNLKSSSSQGTTQYLRNEKSKFDRKNNPEMPASATAMLGVNLNRQNPEFTNFVAARTKFSNKDGKTVTLAQFLGTNQTGNAGLNDPESLQSENMKNVKIAGDVRSANYYSTMLENDLKALEKALDAKESDYDGKGTAATPEQIKELRDAKKEAQAFVDGAKKSLEHNGGAFVVLEQDNNGGTFKWGDEVSTGKNADTADIGLVGMNFVDQDKLGANKTGNASVQGTEKESVSTTRIFGRYFLADDNPGKKVTDGGKYNSYRKATTVAVASGLNKDLMTGKAVKDSTKVEHMIGVEPMKLNNVQYGRVTGNVDPLGSSSVTDADYIAGGVKEKREPFSARNNENAVNYYFYRGTEATTLGQMKALPSDQILQYQGHALMYGIDNSFHGNGDNLPNAFGNSSSVALGNFVVAKYNVAKSEVAGQVYNAWQLNNKNAELTIDPLVNFSGAVNGNTAVGSAELAYKEAPKADFRASFFGKNAEELGGSFNSTTFKQKYGPAKGVQEWGGVFGAQRITESVSEDNNNSWLGDIAADVRK